jgi:oxygen-independent coproporphyrinogen-3 oxidase
MPERAYLGALLDDLEYAARDVPGRRIVSVFFGGGTPSLFAPASIASVLERARDVLGFDDGLEVTLEANPGTVEHGRFEEYAAAGVNRVSLGAQSFDDAKLQALGRIHAADDVGRAVAEVRRAGIDNFNLDLMYALPGQDLDGALADLDRAIDLGPTHVSQYQLTLEPGTPFAKHAPPGLPDDDLVLEMQQASEERLAAAGYEQYEVSAYARPGRRCRHNLVYWRFDDYLGIGAGAHGKVSIDGRVERTVRVRHPAGYLAAPTAAARLAARRVVSAAELPFEYCLNTLRLADGFTADEFEAKTGLARDVLERPSEAVTRRGLLEAGAGRWRPTPLGRRFLNDLQAAFLPG